MKDEKHPAPEDIEYISDEGKPRNSRAETAKPASKSAAKAVPDGTTKAAPDGTARPASDGTAEGKSPEAPEPAEAHHDESIAEAARHLREKIKKKDAEIKSLRKELDEFKDQYLRKLADM